MTTKTAALPEGFNHQHSGSAWDGLGVGSRMFTHQRFHTLSLEPLVIYVPAASAGQAYSCPESVHR
jgi:hypothetical protein